MIDVRSRCAPACASALVAAMALAPAPTAHAAGGQLVVTGREAEFDRWNYPFNQTPGTRGIASTFGAVGAPGFDDRDAQFLLGFDTADAGVATGRPLSDYQIHSLSVTVTHSTGAFAYDPTYDPIAGDSDAGKPIVLTGAGLRGGLDAFTFGSGTSTAYGEGSLFGDHGPTPFAPDAGDRSAFAAGFDQGGDLIDISNNVTQGLDINPWAVGQTSVAAGAFVPEATSGSSPGATFTFDLAGALLDDDIRGYLQQGLADGGLFFTVSSLHATTLAGGNIPMFYTADNADAAAVAPQISFDVTVVPEPVSAATVATGLALTLVRRPRRRG